MKILTIVLALVLQGCAYTAFSDPVIRWDNDARPLQYRVLMNTDRYVTNYCDYRA